MYGVRVLGIITYSLRSSTPFPSTSRTDLPAISPENLADDGTPTDTKTTAYLGRE